MIRRKGWLARMEAAWRNRSIIWLSGVRRAGKTVLSRSIPGVEYHDCELPRVRSEMGDPEGFLARRKGCRVVLDEIHRLGNPSELLKIAADHFPSVKIVATGSSTLGASRKFRDTLTGRKTSVWLTPMDWDDMMCFGHRDLSRRMIHGGLPPLFLARRPSESFFAEWMNDYWARDIEELFGIQQKYPFQKFVELVFTASGGMFEATSFARPCEVSRPTIANYLAILESTHVAHVIRPFSSRRAVEIVSAPRVYGFDTGFVCLYRGWSRLEGANRGMLWEHLVLNELQSVLQQGRISYWRDKHGNEVDFVVPRHGRAPVAIECKWSRASFAPGGMEAFTRAYPGAALLLAASDGAGGKGVKCGTATVEVVGLGGIRPAIRRLLGRVA